MALGFVENNSQSEFPQEERRSPKGTIISFYYSSILLLMKEIFLDT